MLISFHDVPEQVVHVVHAGGLDGGDELRRRNGAAGKDLAGEGGVLHLEHLVVPGEDDLVLAHDGAAADGGDAYLLATPGLADAVALKDVLGLVGQGGGCGVGQHQGRAARRVHLAAVVLFDDLDVEALAEHGGSALHELHHKVDAQRHVAGLEHRYPRRGLLDVVQLLLGVARRAQDDGYLPQQAELQQRVEVGGVGEVDDHVGGALVAHGVGIDLKAVLLERRAVEARDDLHTLEPLAAADNALAHVSVAAGDYYL